MMLSLLVCPTHVGMNRLAISHVHLGLLGVIGLRQLAPCG
jgi:hypothetical protein